MPAADMHDLYAATSLRNQGVTCETISVRLDGVMSNRNKSQKVL